MAIDSADTTLSLSLRYAVTATYTAAMPLFAFSPALMMFSRHMRYRRHGCYDVIGGTASRQLPLASRCLPLFATYARPCYAYAICRRLHVTRRFDAYCDFRAYRHGDIDIATPLILRYAIRAILPLRRLILLMPLLFTAPCLLR